MNLQQINELMYSILAILQKANVPNNDMHSETSFYPGPVHKDEEFSLIISKNPYSEKQADMDTFLKNQGLNKMEHGRDYFKIYDKYTWAIQDSM